MKKSLLILISLFLILLLLISLKILFFKTEKRTVEFKSSDSEVTLYLKSGEVIQGKLIEKTNEALILEKHGSSLSFKLDEILKVEESATKKDLTVSYTFPFSTALITYEYKGYLKGKETYYIDTVQNKIAIEIHSDDINNLKIYDGKIFYETNLNEKESTAMEMKGEVTSLLFLEKLYLGFPVKIESFLGKDCKVYHHSKGKTYFWQGILLKDETTNHPLGEEYNSIKEAINIQLNVPIPEDKLKIPEDVQVESFEESLKKLREMRKESKKWQEESKQKERKRLLDKAEKDPEVKKILEKATRKNGTIDFKEARKLIKEKETKELIEKAKKLENGERLIQEATSKEGKVESLKLRMLLYKKEEELREKIDKHLEEAKTLEEQGKYADALRKYVQAIKTKPSERVYLERISLYKKIGEYEKALQDLSSLIGMASSIAESRYRVDRAELYTRMGRYQEAIEDYTKALEIKKKQASEKAALKLKQPESVSKNYRAHLLIKRGEAYRKTCENKKAIADFTMALKLNPEEWYKRKCYFLRGLIYRKMNVKSKTIADWEKAESLGDKLVDGSVVDGKRQGRFVWYHKNASIRAQGIYINNKLEGKYICYYNNGNLKGKGYYKAGKREGTFLWYERTRGYLQKEVNYVKGKHDGVCKHYYDNGNLLEKSTYKNGVRHGMHYKYYENGQVQQMGLFEDGVENGIMTLYKPDGSFKKKILFKKGKRIKDIYTQ